MTILRTIVGKYHNSPTTYQEMKCPDGTFAGFVRGYLSAKHGDAVIESADDTEMVVRFSYGTRIYRLLGEE